MGNKQVFRKIVADFLQTHLDNVRKIEKAKPGSVMMDSYVGEWDGVHQCGTVCCMEGWLPNTFPHLFRWGRVDVRYRDGGVISDPIPEFAKIGADGLWGYLTGILDEYGYGDQYGHIDIWSEFKEVDAAWTKVIKALRKKGGEI